MHTEASSMHMFLALYSAQKLVLGQLMYMVT
jgi:hypothetical protein